MDLSKFILARKNLLVLTKFIINKMKNIEDKIPPKILSSLKILIVVEPEKSPKRRSKFKEPI